MKLSFTITDKDESKGVQPHQTFLRFYDATTGEEGIQPVRVSSSGKAKFELVSRLFFAELGRTDLVLVAGHEPSTNFPTALRRRTSSSFPHPRFIRTRPTESSSV